MAQIATISPMVWEYGGHTIRLDTNSKRFVIVNWDSGTDTFDTFDAAKAEIDRAAKIQAKQSKATMRIEVLAETGKPHFVKGFHLRHATKLYHGDAPNEYSKLYPTNAWIQAKLFRAKELKKEIEEIEKLLAPYVILTSRNPYRSECKVEVGTADAYAESLYRFAKYVEDLTKKAEANKP